MDTEFQKRVVISRLNIHSLATNSIILGCIDEIKDYELSISLPGAIKAYVDILNISDYYSSLLSKYSEEPDSIDHPYKPKAMFARGQCIPIRILSKIEKSTSHEDSSFIYFRVQASINPRLVNEDLSSSALKSFGQYLSLSAAVQSIEEHGYLMNFGLDGVLGFLSNQEAKPFLLSVNQSALKIGQVLLCNILSSSSKVIQLTTKNLKKSKDIDVDLPASCLLPGVQTYASVIDVTHLGVEITIFNKHRGFIHRDYLPSVWDIPKENFKIGNKLNATILYYNQMSKVVALTIRQIPTPKNIEKTFSGINMGKLIDAIFVGRDDNDNFIFKLSDNLKGIVSMKDLSDEFMSAQDIISLENQMPIGSSIKSRIMSIAFFDRSVRLTLKKSLLDSDEVSIDSLEIGSIIKGTVEKLTNKYMIIRLGFGLRALCPFIHWSDVSSLSNPEKRFPQGKALKCRVLRLDKSSFHPQIFVTCKRTLLNPELVLLDDIDKAIPGFKTEGVVGMVNSNGVLLEFFNGIKGFLPIKILKSFDIEYPEKVFRVGQLLTVVVVKANKTENYVSLSLDYFKTNSNLHPKISNETKAKLKIGSVLKNITISEKDEKGFLLSYEGLRLLLPKHHLSDYPESFENLYKLLNVGNIIDEAMVFKANRDIIIMTKKFSFINAYSKNRFLTSQDDLQIGIIVPCIVQAFKSYGMFVDLSGGFKALVPTRNMSDKNIMCPEDAGYVTGQTLLGSLEQIKYEENKFVLEMSTKAQDVICESQEHVLENYIKEQRLIKSLLSENGSKMQRLLCKLKIGDFVSYRITEIQKNGNYISEVYIKRKSKSVIKALTLGCEGSLIGAQGEAIVIEIDTNNEHIVISANAELMKRIKKGIRTNVFERLEKGNVYSSYPCLVSDKWVLFCSLYFGSGFFTITPRWQCLNGGENTFVSGKKCKLKIFSILDKTVVAKVVDVYTVSEVFKKRKAKEENASNIRQKRKKLKHIVHKISQENDMQVNEKKKDILNEKLKKSKKQKHFKKVGLIINLNKKSFLDIGTTFEWEEENNDIEQDDTHILIADEEKVKPAKKKQKKIHNSDPVSKDEFEESLKKDPSDVISWLKYIEHYLSTAEIEKAKSVARRALEQVCFKDEECKLKIWVKLLRIEYENGTQESLEELFKEGLNCNDELKLYKAMIDIYDKSNKPEATEQLYKEMVKKFKTNKQVWIDFGSFYMRRKFKDSCRSLLTKCLDFLEPKDHPDVICKFAQMEFANGDFERGKSLFERVVNEKGKKINFWIVYQDMMMKYGKASDQEIRAIFERMLENCHKKLLVFKRWISWEKKNHNDEMVQELQKRIEEK